GGDRVPRHGIGCGRRGARRRPGGAGGALRPADAARLGGGAGAVPDRRAPCDPGAVRAGRGGTAGGRRRGPPAGGGGVLVGRAPVLQCALRGRRAGPRVPVGRGGGGGGVGRLRRRLPAADRGRVGVRLPRRNGRAALRPARRDRLVPRQFAGTAARGRREAAERVGAARHARRRVGVVLGPVRPGGLRRLPGAAR